MMKGRLLALLALVVALPAAAQTGPLRIGTVADNPPLAYQAEGRSVGMEIDFSRLLQAQLGQPVQLQVFTAAELLPALARGDIDLAMAGLTVTPERRQQVDFVEPYLHTGQMAVIRTADIARFGSPVALAQGGFRVGVIAGGAGAEYVRAELTNVSTVTCPTADECLQGLLAQRIDVFIDSAATSWRIATDKHYGALMSLYRPLTDEALAWAVSKDKPQLRERLGSALQSMQRQPMFEHILNRWIPVRIETE